MNCKMKFRITVIACGTALLIAAAVVVALRERQQSVPPPEASVAQTPAEVRVKAVERKTGPVAEGELAAASGAVAIVCGEDAATAGRYEARNDALRSIARRRDLPKNDIDALLAYLRSKDRTLPVERFAALKNDVMNILRNQAPPPANFAETLVAMFNGKRHPPAVLDYCIQHLGAMVNSLDEPTRLRVRGVLAKASGEKGKPYSGTALYSLAEDRRATPSQAAELKRLTLALCKPEAHPAARMAAIQLAGQRGCREALPALRETLAAPARDAALDIVSIGSIGLLGDARDIALLSRFSSDRRCAAAVEAAIKRINEREVAK